MKKMNSFAKECRQKDKLFELPDLKKLSQAYKRGEICIQSRYTDDNGTPSGTIVTKHEEDWGLDSFDLRYRNYKSIFFKCRANYLPYTGCCCRVTSGTLGQWEERSEAINCFNDVNIAVPIPDLSSLVPVKVGFLAIDNKGGTAEWIASTNRVTLEDEYN